MRLLSLFLAAVVVTFVPSCKNGATLQTHDTSPANFSDQNADYYFSSVAVDWSDGTFSDNNTKVVRIYIADDRLDSRGSRSGELFSDSWEIQGGLVETDYHWEADLLTIKVSRASDGHPLLSKTFKIVGNTAFLVQDTESKKKPNKSEMATPRKPSD